MVGVVPAQQQDEKARYRFNVNKTKPSMRGLFHYCFHLVLLRQQFRLQLHILQYLLSISWLTYGKFRDHTHAALSQIPA
jgi:hypothetical protein